MQDVDGGGVGGEDCGETLVAVGGLVEAAAAEDDARLQFNLNDGVFDDPTC